MSVSPIHVSMEELVWMAFTVSPACALLFTPDNDVKVLKRYMKVIQIATFFEHFQGRK